MAYTDRFKDAPWFKESSKETIIVGGAGGIGSNTLYYMTKTIPAKYYIFDNDTVVEHNIGTQFFTKDSLSKFKVEAIKTILTNFGISENNLQIFRDKIDSNILPIAIAGFDNMAARKQMYTNWKNLDNREIFIDGRLSANMYQVFTVVKGREEWYEKTLFEDSAVAEAPCTFKQTAYFAGLIGARITHLLVNYLSNKYANEDIFNIPFLVEESGEPFTIKTCYNYEDI